MIRNVQYRHRYVGKEGGDPLNYYWVFEWEFTTPDGSRHGSSVKGSDLFMRAVDPLLMEIVEAQMAQMVQVAWELAKEGKHDGTNAEHDAGGAQEAPGGVAGGAGDSRDAEARD